MLESLLADSGWLTSAVLLAILGLGAYTDLRWRRLPNWLTFGGAFLGLGLNTALFGLSGAWESLLGWVVGCLLLFLPFALGGMGAGDVKMLAAVGAVAGPWFVLTCFVYMALVGGIVAVALLAKRHGLRDLARRAFAGLRFGIIYLVRFRALPPRAALLPAPIYGQAGAAAPPESKSRGLTLPYGVAIAAGGLLALALGY